MLFEFQIIQVMNRFGTDLVNIPWIQIRERENKQTNEQTNKQMNK